MAHTGKKTGENGEGKENYGIGTGGMGWQSVSQRQNVKTEYL